MRFSYGGHTAVSFCVYRPPPSRQNKLTNAMFLEQFSDLLELYVSCDGLFVVGDLNVHFDKRSDPSTPLLNVVLDNLSLHQLVKVPTRRCVYTLDWLITNCATIYSVYIPSQCDYLSFQSFMTFFFVADPQLHKLRVPSDFPVLACCLKD